MKPRYVVIIAAGLLVALGVGAWVLSRSAEPPAVPPTPLAARGPGVVPPGASSVAKPEAPAAETSAKPLPPLVPGSPLDDEQFAAISAQIVIASVGLKKQKDWELLVLDYMDQTLAKANITPDQYREYAEALYEYPDRGRAMADNIMRRVEKKLGTRVDMKTLPMLKFDRGEVDRLQKKLKR